MDIPEQLKLALFSNTVVDFKLQEYGTLILYIEDSENTTGQITKSTFWIETPWRITSDNKIECGYLEDLTKILNYLNQNIRGMRISDIQIDQFSDLRITFENDLILGSFSYFADAEQWEFRHGATRIGCGDNFKLYSLEIPPE
jgi:hypothetical protein